MLYTTAELQVLHSLLRKFNILWAWAKSRGLCFSKSCFHCWLPHIVLPQELQHKVCNHTDTLLTCWKKQFSAFRFFQFRFCEAYLVTFFSTWI